MTSSLIELAIKLDEASHHEGSTITESASSIIVDGVIAPSAAFLAEVVERLAWPYVLEDATAVQINRDEVSPDFAPYRLEIRKPAGTISETLIVTNTGFHQLLTDGRFSAVIRIVGLSRSFSTYATFFASFDDQSNFIPRQILSDPRRIVKEASSVRSVPSDLSSWILRDPDTFAHIDKFRSAWAEVAIRVVLRSLASEIDADGTLTFKGPPISKLTLSSGSDQFASDVIVAIMRIAQWTFADDQGVEIRHGLFAAEMARTAVKDADAHGLTVASLEAALEGARISNQLGLNQLSRDTLKIMADLRKSISEEATKLSDATRQLATSVSGALLAGIGVITAKLTVSSVSAAVSYAVLALGIVICLFIIGIVVSGIQFVRLQRDLRNRWKDKLYRFMSIEDYRVMVQQPATQAERAFFTASWISGILAVALMCAVVGAFWLNVPSNKGVQEDSIGLIRPHSLKRIEPVSH